jgi:hypothetical protein
MHADVGTINQRHALVVSARDELRETLEWSITESRPPAVSFPGHTSVR